MKGIHPEFFWGKKGGNYEKIINYLGTIPDGELDADQLLSSLDKRQKGDVLKETGHSLSSNDDIFVNYRTNPEEEYKPATSFELIHGFFHRLAKEKPCKVYSVGREFFMAVAEIKRDIPIKYLNKQHEKIYVKTAPIKIDGDICDGFYFSPSSDLNGLVSIYITVANRYSISSTKALVLGSSNGADKIDIMDNDGTIFVGTVKNSDANLTGYIRGALNTVLYINSQDPVIDQLRPQREYNPKEIGAMSILFKENLCTLPVTLVNWSYHGRKYNVDSTMVSTHMRWQPCGPGRSDVKLVWVKEHERHYQKPLDEIQEQAQV